jgi:hypothetical protein
VRGNGIDDWNIGGNVVWICLFGVVQVIPLALILRARRRNQPALQEDKESFSVAL